MVEQRLDRRLTSRIDVCQFLRDARSDAMSRLGEFAGDRRNSPYTWFRALIRQRLDATHLHHLGEASNAAGRELSLFRDSLPTASSATLAAQLLGLNAEPSEATARAGRILRVQGALNAMGPEDREVLSLRHFEHLSGLETAQELGLEESIVTRRYVVALKRLKEILSST
jgi:RNA polymerase sigma-70 factor (ECF subfamily)